MLQIIQQLLLIPIVFIILHLKILNTVGFIKIVRFVLFMVITVLLFSCDKFEGGQTIPSYLQVDTIYLKDNPQIEEGKRTHNFTDVWVYVDDQIIGSFELRGTDAEPPLVIPVLAEGVHKVSLYAGIKYNGMSGTRGPYPFVIPMIYENVNFTIDSIIQKNPEVSYYENTSFVWIEEFEDASLTVIPTSNSDTTISIFQHNPVHPALGHQSGIGYIDSDNTVFEISSTNPETYGVVVLLEMEYNINVHMAVGLFIRIVGVEIKQHAVLILNPTNDEWKKVYVNFTAGIDANPNGDYFNVYFRAVYESGVGTGIIKLDNLKLIHRGLEK